MKLIVLILIILSGSLVTAAVDSHLGLGKVFLERPMRVQVAHKVIYMLYGGALAWVIFWY